MTDTPTSPTDQVEAAYLIRKGAYWYRPNAAGYTGRAHEAGRYTREEAYSYSHPNGPDGPRDGIDFLHISEVPALASVPAPDKAVDWRKLAINLAMREADYRLNHDVHGDGDMKAGRAWDKMRQSGDRIREAALTSTDKDARIAELLEG